MSKSLLGNKTNIYKIIQAHDSAAYIHSFIQHKQIKRGSHVTSDSLILFLYLSLSMEQEAPIWLQLNFSLLSISYITLVDTENTKLSYLDMP